MIVNIKTSNGSYQKQYFILLRWMGTFNVSMASNHKQRAVSKEWCGSNFCVEEAPFLFNHKDKKGVHVVGSAAWGYICDLPSAVISFVNNLDT